MRIGWWEHLQESPLFSYRWVCLKIGYIPNYSHLIGIMISKTIGFRGTLFSDKPLISAPRRRLVRFHRCIFHFRRCRFHCHWSGGRHFHAHLVGHQDLRRQRWKSRGNGGFHQQKIGFGLIRWRFSMIQPTFEISPTTFGFQPTKRLDLTDKRHEDLKQQWGLQWKSPLI